MRRLVTGATGYFGGRLAPRLLAECLGYDRAVESALGLAGASSGGP